jgi:hypothetical protein
MKLKLNTLVLSLAAAFILSSCGSGGNKAKQELPTETLEQGIVSLAGAVPPLTEIPYFIQSIGADYNQSLINSRENIDTYVTQPDKSALNLGVFAADMGYLSAYEKTQECIDYFNACKHIADQMGIIETFPPALVKGVEDNIGNRDTLAVILNATIARADSLLTATSQSKLAALVLTGSFVESLHIATGIVRTYPKTAFSDPKQRNQLLTPLIEKIIKQGTSVSKVTNVLKQLKGSESIDALITDLEELDARFKAINVNYSDPKFTFSDETLTSVTEAVEKLRADIVNVK